MSKFRCTVALVLVLLWGASAQAQDKSRSLDSVDDGASKSLDAAYTGKSVDPDADDTGGSASLDAAEAGSPTPLPAPAALPEIDDAATRAQAQSAREAVLVAQQRVQQANASYSSMMTRDYPQGDARAAIVQERDAAAAAYQQASARYAAMLSQLQ